MGRSLAWEDLGSFAHETESQVILNGSRDINFTMDLVVKDVTLFQSIAEEHQVPLELSPVLVDIFLKTEGPDSVMKSGHPTS